jgi:hypothetical protein
MIEPSNTHYLIYTTQSGEEQRVAKIQHDSIEIYDSNLKNVMRRVGIQIPPHLQGQFEGKKNVYLDDSERALFIKAFVDVYFKFHMDKRFYRLRLANP